MVDTVILSLQRHDTWLKTTRLCTVHDFTLILERWPAWFMTQVLCMTRDTAD